MADETFNEEISITIEAGQTLVLDITAKKKEQIPVAEKKGSVEFFIFNEDDSKSANAEAYLVLESKGYYKVPIGMGPQSIPQGTYQIALIKPEGIPELITLPEPPPPEPIEEEQEEPAGQASSVPLLSEVQLNQMMFSQLNLSGYNGPIDQDTGNCSFTAKMFLMKIADILKPTSTLDQLLNSFYTHPISIVNTVRYIQGKLTYRKITGQTTAPGSDPFNTYDIAGQLGFGDTNASQEREIFKLDTSHVVATVTPKMYTGDSPTFNFRPDFIDPSITFSIMRGVTQTSIRKKLAVWNVRPELNILTTEGLRIAASPTSLSLSKIYTSSSSSIIPTLKVGSAYLVRHPDHFWTVYITRTKSIVNAYEAWILDPLSNSVVKEDLLVPSELGSFNGNITSMFELIIT